MKKGDWLLVIVFVILVAIIIVVAVAYYSPKITGSTVEEFEEEIGENVKLADFVLIEPLNLKVYVEVGKDGQEMFSLTNAYDSDLIVGCGISNFDKLEPDSICYSYDENGNFVGLTKDAIVLSGERRNFFVKAYTLEDVNLKSDDGTKYKFTTPRGSYKREVILELQEKENLRPEEIRIPLEIIVE